MMVWVLLLLALVQTGDATQSREVPTAQTLRDNLKGNFSPAYAITKDEGVAQSLTQQLEGKELVSGGNKYYAPCPDCWTKYARGKICLKFFSEPLNYRDAQSFCKGKDGNLVQIRGRTLAYIITDMTAGREIYIGVRDNFRDNTFRYLDGTPLGVFHPWSSVTPVKDSFSVKLDVDNKWQKVSGWDRLPFVCETDYFPTGKCPEGWEPYNLEGKCLKAQVTKMKWSEAREACLQQGSELVQLRFEDDNKADVVNALGQDQYILIGLRDPNKNGNWIWLDGSPQTKNKKWWHYKHEENEGKWSCAVLYQYANSYNLVFRALPCDSKRVSVCERDMEF